MNMMVFIDAKVYNIVMHFYEISPVGIVGRDFSILTYSSSENFARGAIVEIPVGKAKKVGVVIKKVAQPNFATKEISRALFPQELPENLLRLHAWISEFYATHSGTTWQTMLPSGLNKNRRETKKSGEKISEKDENSPQNLAKKIPLNAEQKRTISEIEKAKNGTIILHGITGSGKTNIYLSLAQKAIAKGKDVIILVPEISLTAQIAQNFRDVFGEKVFLTHSTMTEAQRAKIWREILANDAPKIIIGPRSALFMPTRNLGLIVIDECHETSYQQEQAPRYNALRAAAFLAKISQVKLILGSATPLISDIYLAKKFNAPIVEMNKLAVSNAKKPRISIIDLKNRDNFSSRSAIFSRQLIGKIAENLAAKKQILLFHNRRGSATINMCENCGWTAECPRCFLPLTLHADQFLLRCHICNFKQKPPTFCPECQGTNLIYRGVGTKKIEAEISRIFPDAKVRRFDGDTPKSQTVAEIFAEIKYGAIDAIVGTQTIAKGLDLPRLGLVGVVQADAGLNLPDFFAAEKTFQLISQAIGRVGRTATETEAIIQTFQPDSPIIQFAAAQNFAKFYEYEIQNRAKGHFPPFCFLLKLTCRYKTERGAANAVAKMSHALRKKFGEKAQISEAMPAFHERSRGDFVWQIIVRSKNHQILGEIARTLPAKNWSAEIDPISLL